MLWCVRSTASAACHRVCRLYCCLHQATFARRGSQYHDLRPYNHASQALRHPNVVQFLGACSKLPNLAMVTEHMPHSLHSVLYTSNTALDRARVISLAQDIARAFIYLHSRKPAVIHRDIKPANFLLDRAWKVKVSVTLCTCLCVRAYVCVCMYGSASTVGALRAYKGSLCSPCRSVTLGSQATARRRQARAPLATWHPNCLMGQHTMRR